MDKFWFVILILMILALSASLASAQDGRCDQLRALKAQGADRSGQFSRAQVIAATAWYHANCGTQRRTTRASAR